MKQPIRVLIIEDSEFDALILVNLLKQGGYKPDYKRVETEATMRAALSDETWDVILSDYNMPDFGALEALRITQESRHDLPFIIISGGIGEDTAVAAMKAGAHDYLMKGNLARLVPAVERETREAAIRAARRDAEGALRESELRYRLLWETATDAVILIDDSGTIRFANPAVRAVFGYDPQELTGQKLEILEPERLREINRKHIERFLDLGVAATKWRTIETFGRRSDGTEILIEIGFGEMELHAKRWFVGFIRDITQRKMAEKTLRENAEQFRIARDIQQRLFPKNPPSVPGFEIAGASVPAAATGGDYFDYLSMLNDHLGIVVGDVTGHGIGPALLMAETRAYLRIVARNREDAGEILTRTNRVLAEDIGREHFITMLLARIDPVRRKLVYANAGHPAGFVLGGDGALKMKLTRTGVPLGLRSTAEYRPSTEVDLESGDVLLLITDGVEETLSPDDDFFGADRVLEVARAHLGDSSGAMVDALFDAVRDFAGDQPQADDLTAVAIRVL